MKKESLITAVLFREQIADVRATTDMDAYADLYDTYFDAKESDWIGLVDTELQLPEFKDVPEDFYRMMGLVGILFAQYGFPMMDGQKLRHERQEWEKSFLDPQHQLAVCIYAANLNVQSYSMKADRLESFDDQSIAVAALGTPINVFGGKTLETATSGSSLNSRIKRRANNGVPITLPYKRLNHQLRQISFTGDDAESMSQEQFGREILPQVNQVLGKIIKPVTLFMHNNK